MNCSIASIPYPNLYLNHAGHFETLQNTESAGFFYSVLNLNEYIFLIVSCVLYLLLGQMNWYIQNTYKQCNGIESIVDT